MRQQGGNIWRCLCILLLIIQPSGLFAGANNPSPSPTASGSGTTTTSGTLSGTSSITTSASSSLTRSPSASLSTHASVSPTASSTMSMLATFSSLSSKTSSSTPSSTVSLSLSSTATSSPSMSDTTTVTSSSTLTPSSTSSPSVSLTQSSTTTPSPSESVTPSSSPTISSSSSSSVSPTLSPTSTVSTTVTNSPSITVTRSSTATRSASRSPRPTTTSASTATSSRSTTASPTPTTSSSSTRSSTGTKTSTKTTTTSKTPLPTVSSTASVTASASGSSSVSTTSSPSISSSSTYSSSVSRSALPSSSSARSPSSTRSSLSTRTAKPSESATRSAISSRSPTQSSSATKTPTVFSAQATISSRPSRSSSATATPTVVTGVATKAPTTTASSSRSASGTRSSSSTTSPTGSMSSSVSASASVSSSASNSFTPSSSVSQTTTRSPTVSRTTTSSPTSSVTSRASVSSTTSPTQSRSAKVSATTSTSARPTTTSSVSRTVTASATTTRSSAPTSTPTPSARSVPISPWFCGQNEYFISNTTYCGRCYELSPGQFSAAHAGVCSRCSENAFATVDDNGRGNSCRCRLGYAQSYDLSGKLVCTLCKEGMQSTPNIPGVPSMCDMCGGGYSQTDTINGNTGARIVTCRMCLQGWFAPPGSNKCFPCAAGTTTELGKLAGSQAECTVTCKLSLTYSTGSGGACRNCTTARCPPGKRVQGCTTTEDSKCLDCPSGSFSVKGVSGIFNTTCTACYDKCGILTTNVEERQKAYSPAYCSTTVDTVCQCSSGYYRNSTAKLLSDLVCKSCKVNEYSFGGADSICLPCPNGTFAPAGRYGLCVTCSDENAIANTQIDPGDGRTCLCAAGYAQTGTGKTSTCTYCGAGAFATRGSPTCTVCKAGQFMSEEDSLSTTTTRCGVCGPGTYSPTERSASCYECALGYFNPLSGASKCEPCPIGFFNRDVGKWRCEMCPAGKTTLFLGGNSSNACVDIPPGFRVSSLPRVSPALATPTALPGTVTVLGAIEFSTVPASAFGSVQSISDLEASILSVISKRVSVTGQETDGMDVKVRSVKVLKTGETIFYAVGRDAARRRLQSAAGVKVDYTVIMLWNVSSASGTVAEIAKGTAAQSTFASEVAKTVQSTAAASGNADLAAGMIGVTAKAALPTLPIPPTPVPSPVPAILGALFSIAFSATGYIFYKRRSAKIAIEKEELEKFEADQRAQIEAERVRAELGARVMWGDNYVPFLTTHDLIRLKLDHREKLSRILPEDAPHSQQVLQSVPQLAQNVVIFIGSYIIGARAYGAITRFINSRFRQPKLRSLGRWAVVTGGSDGIGLAYATELARHNMSIAIIARSLTKLQAAKESIRRAVPNADVEIITADFSQRDCVAKLRGELFLKIAPDEIGVLINNVGTNTPALYFDPLESNIHANGSRETLNNVNVVAATEMTALVMTYMVAKGKGLIVNVSSGFGRIPSGAPFYAQYSASKAYIDFFSRSLHYEVKPLGVHVQCQVPYLVATELAGVKKTSLFVPSPETYAKAAVADFFSGPVSVPYWPHAIEDSLASSLPVQFVAGQIYKLNANTRERYCTKQKRLADIAVERAMNALRGNEISDGETKKSNGGGGGGGGGAGAERGISRSKRSGGKN